MAHRQAGTVGILHGVVAGGQHGDGQEADEDREQPLAVETDELEHGGSGVKEGGGKYSPRPSLWTSPGAGLRYAVPGFSRVLFPAPKTFPPCASAFIAVPLPVTTPPL